MNATPAPAPRSNEPPTVIAHRGTAYRPENTKEGITNAARKGAPWVEIDIRCSRNGVLFAMHDRDLSRTSTGTGYIDQRSSKYIRRLRAVERWAAYRRRSASFDGDFKIPTLVGVMNRARDEGVGLLIDAKTRDCERKMLDRLQAAYDGGLPVRFAAVDDDQRRFANDNYTLPLATHQLRPTEVNTQAKIAAEVSTASRLEHVDTLSVRWDAVTPELVDAAHAQGLQVVVWTFRAQNVWLPAEYRSCDDNTLACRRKRGDLAGWIDVFTAMDVDGVMADEPNHTGLL